MRRIFAVFFALLFLTAPVYAQNSLDPTAEPKVKAQLIAENDGIKPGDTFRVGLKQEITPGWHTYWRNPGDTGLETKIDWQLPPGFTASEMHFPTPSREPASGLMNFGYENSVLIPVDITPPGDLKIGDEIEIKGKASWLVCSDICIPENATFLLTLKVTDNPAPGPWQSAFMATDKKLPQKHDSRMMANIMGDNIVLVLDPLPMRGNELPEEAFFFPHDPQLIMNASPQKLEMNGRQVKLSIPRTKTRTTPITDVSGDFWFRNAMGEYSYQFKATVPQPTAPAIIPTVSAPPTPGTPVATPPAKMTEIRKLGFFSVIIGAFLGGLILNLMPCVFPVLSLKALGLVYKSQHESRREVIFGGVIYTLGVLATFSILGLVLVILRGAGHNIGWGAQLQSPKFVAGMALLLFFVGYTLTGAVTLGSRLIGVGNSLTHLHGHIGTFFTGALAVVVATPCTAPFMGGAIFYALTQPWYVTLFVMLAMGLGLSFPYLFLTLVPNALKFLPRPGAWMEYFKQFLAFPMFAAAIWLVWVIAQQTGANGVLFVLGSMLCLGFGFWLWKTADNRLQTWWQILKKVLAVASVLFAFVMVSYQPMNMTAQAAPAQSSENFIPYSGAKLAELRSQNKAVFVDMTAAWCITCLANDKTALSSARVMDFFRQNNITFMKGDWTNYDDGITAFLKEYGRSGVPLYVFFPADQAKAPIVLPQLLTPDTVIDTINQPTGASS
jgi:thiol:disulfide interchange protein DsbD